MLPPVKATPRFSDITSWVLSGMQRRSDRLTKTAYLAAAENPASFLHDFLEQPGGPGTKYVTNPHSQRLEADRVWRYCETVTEEHPITDWQTEQLADLRYQQARFHWPRGKASATAFAVLGAVMDTAEEQSTFIPCASLDTLAERANIASPETVRQALALLARWEILRPVPDALGMAWSYALARVLRRCTAHDPVPRAPHRAPRLQQQAVPSRTEDPLAVSGPGWDHIWEQMLELAREVDPEAVARTDYFEEQIRLLENVPLDLGPPPASLGPFSATATSAAPASPCSHPGATYMDRREGVQKLPVLEIALGPTLAALVGELGRGGIRRTGELARTLGCSVRTIYTGLRTLLSHGLASKDGTRWQKGPADPAEVATALGAPQILATRAERRAERRRKWLSYLAGIKKRVQEKADRVAELQKHKNRNVLYFVDKHRARRVRFRMVA